MSDRYTHQDKLLLAKKIEDIRDMDNIKKVKKIIYNNNKGLKKTVDGSDVMMNFHNLTLKTYQELDNFFEAKKIKKYKQRRKELESLTYSEKCNTHDVKDVKDVSGYDTTVKYTNKEKDILRRKHHEKRLNEYLGKSEDVQNYEDYHKKKKKNGIIDSEVVDTSLSLSASASASASASVEPESESKVKAKPKPKPKPKPKTTPKKVLAKGKTK